MEFKELFTLGGFAFMGLILWVFLCLNVISIFKNIVALRWPIVTGTLDSIEIIEEKDNDGVTYVPKAEYSYMVKGNLYNSNNISFGYRGSTSEKEALHICKIFQNQSKVPVAYNPKKPQQSALLTGLQRFQIKEVLLLILILIIFYPLTLTWVVMIKEILKYLQGL